MHSLDIEKWPYKVFPNEQISFEKFCSIIDESIIYNLPSIELNGENEPFLYKDLIKCIKYAKKKGILQISLHTNGVLLNKKLLKEVIDSGLTNISFSVDAVKEETYNKIRVGGNYNKVVKNINNLLEMKKEYNSIFPLIRVSFYKNKINYNEISEFRKVWENKVDVVSFSSFYNPFVESSKYNMIEKRYRIEGYRTDLCYEPYQRLFIFNNGNVSPCCTMFGGNLIVGNIYKNSIYDIWHGNKIGKIRNKLRNKKSWADACRKCHIGYMRKGI